MCTNRRPFKLYMQQDFLNFPRGVSNLPQPGSASDSPRRSESEVGRAWSPGLGVPGPGRDRTRHNATVPGLAAAGLRP